MCDMTLNDMTVILGYIKIIIMSWYFNISSNTINGTTGQISQISQFFYHITQNWYFDNPVGLTIISHNIYTMSFLINNNQ